MVRHEIKHGQDTIVIDFRYTDTAGKRQRFRKVADVQTMTAARAEDARLRSLASATGSPHGSGASEGMTFARFVDGPWTRLYLPRHRPATRERYLALLGQGIKAHFGHLPLDRIAAGHVLSYASELVARGVRSRPHTSLVSAILRAAVESRVLARMPDLPAHEKASKKLPDCPATSEVIAIVARARGWVRLAVELAAYAGLRSGEVRALEVGDVDLRAGMLHVRRAYSSDDVLTPKGDKERDVPIAPELLPDLTAACRRKLPGARVVLTERGTTPSRQNVLKRLTRVERRKPALRPRSFHALRHHFCSSLLARGASVEAVRIVAGHEDLETTARYLHATVDEVARVMAGHRAVTEIRPKRKQSQKRGRKV